MAGKAEEIVIKLAIEGINDNKVVLEPLRKGGDREVLEGTIEFDA